MSFSEQYANLETAFMEQVEKDNGYFDSNPESQFLPNISPEAPVDYVLIAMEPSFGGGSGESSPDDHPPKNFSGSMEDFILHFCVQNYLCKNSGTYYLTDLSKGAMPIRIANSERHRRYKMWYPLLEQELNLVLKPDGMVIAIGNVVEGFLKEQGLPQFAGKVMHYAKTAVSHWAKMPRRYPERYSAFTQTVSCTDIENTVRRVIKDAGMPLSETKKTLQRLRNGSGLTDSRKMLMFTYLCQFEEILAAANR